MMACSISSSLVLIRNHRFQQLSPGSSVKELDKFDGGLKKLSSGSTQTGRRLRLTTLPASKRKSTLVQAASRSDGGRPSSASIFVGGFVLGGLIVGALGCVYAPQISKALASTDRKDLMRRLPKFIYDEEKALERTRKILAEKIEQLNSAIDDVSAQLRSEDAPNGATVNPDEIEATI